MASSRSFRHNWHTVNLIERGFVRKIDVPTDLLGRFQGRFSSDYVVKCPHQKGTRFGTFDQWNQITRGAVVWAGLPDPLETLEYAKQNNEAGGALRFLIAGFLEIHEGRGGLTAAEIIQRLNDTKD